MTPERERAFGIWALLIVVAAMAFGAWAFSRSEGAGAAGPPPPPGGEGVLRRDGEPGEEEQEVPVGATAVDYYRWADAERAGDLAAVAELLRGGRADLARRGERARFLEHHPRRGLYRVRLLSGAHRGEAGWVAAAWFRRR